MFDFSNLTNNLEGSTLTNVIVIALVSFVLSSLIALIYQKTSKELETPRYFIQSLILISIPVATVMQAIGDSLARGLGMLGALAIIRFRTTLRNPRNMVFMFTSISVGIAVGVYGIIIAVIGTVAFCIVVTLIHFSEISKKSSFIATLHFEIPNNILIEGSSKIEIENILTSNCKKTTLTKFTINNKKKEETTIDIASFEFKIKIENKEKATILVNNLSKLNGIINVRVNFEEGYEKI